MCSDRVRGECPSLVPVSADLNDHNLECIPLKSACPPPAGPEAWRSRDPAPPEVALVQGVARSCSTRVGGLEICAHGPREDATTGDGAWPTGAAGAGAPPVPTHNSCPADPGREYRRRSARCAPRGEGELCVLPAQRPGDQHTTRDCPALGESVDAGQRDALPGARGKCVLCPHRAPKGTRAGQHDVQLRPVRTARRKARGRVSTTGSNSSHDACPNGAEVIPSFRSMAP